jgi:DNA-binding GntR family transcriptional regulator
MADIGYEWQRVANDVARRIGSGELPPGSMLRGERMLAEEYGVALGTIRRAVRDLRERGLIVTLPAKGTFVAERPPELSPRSPPAVPGWPLLDASGCVLSGPRVTGSARVPSPGMYGEEPEEKPRIHLRNSERRYVQVADDLEARIRAGEFPYDAALPRREDLAREYGVGEMTVRRALGMLADRGLVRPMSSVGTVVIWAGHNRGT